MADIPTRFKFKGAREGRYGFVSAQWDNKVLVNIYQDTEFECMGVTCTGAEFIGQYEYSRDDLAKRIEPYEPTP